MTKLRTSFGGPLAGCALAFFSACGSNDDPQFLVPIEGDPEQTQVSDLDDAQLQNLCGSYARYVDAEISFDTVSHALCLVSAQLASFNTATCQAVFDECIAGAPEPLSIRAQIENVDTCAGSLRNCDASVARVETCLNVQLDGLVDLLDSLACGGASDGSRQRANDWMTGASACADLGRECTEFAEPVTLQ